MNWFSALRRCEELTMEVAQLRKDLADKTKEVTTARKNEEALSRKLYEARRDNSRLIQINAYLANEAGRKPNKSNIQ